MAQHDLTIGNQTFPSFRNDLNNGLQALGTCFSGASAPTTTYPCMLWADTTANQLKQRNTGNTTWITLGALNTNFLITPANIGAATPSDVSTSIGNVLRVVATRTLDATATGAGTFIDMPLDTKSRDIGNEYNNSTFTYVAPSAGLYEFQLTISIFSSLTPTNLIIGAGLNVNGTDRLLNVSSTNKNYATASGNIAVNLSSGASVKPRYFLDSVDAGGVITLQGASNPPVFTVKKWT